MSSFLWDNKNVLKVRGSGCTTLNVNELFTLILLLYIMSISSQ